MDQHNKVTAQHLKRDAYLYVRQSSLHQVRENRESTARQYDLKRRALTLGWDDNRIVVIDEDLGLSGASALERNGFQRLVAQVGLGRVGLVMGLEVSRLARNSTDWHRLLEICALAQTLILDEDGIYDPSHFNDRLLLGLKGTMSEAELYVLRARLIGGQLNKARRGELWIPPPIGFCYNSSQQLVLNPDEQIQNTVKLFFETFNRTGSALRTVRHFSQNNILFPRRVPSGPRIGEIMFVPLTHSRTLNILHNPRYTGAYVYGRTRQSKMRIAGQAAYQKLPKQDWKVFLPNTHPAYITWEQFEVNQTKLIENAYGYGTDRRKSPPREGSALLQGLVICGQCGNRMTIRYYQQQGRLVPCYVCQRAGIESAVPICQSIPGAAIDQAVAEIVLKSVTPASLEVAIEVFEQLQMRKNEIDRIHRAEVQRAKEDAELAQRQYLLVRPENRLVADNLEREWNRKLHQLSEVQEKYKKIVNTDGIRITAEEKDRIYGLAVNLPKVWYDSRTPMREKKRLLRLLIQDVTLTRTHMILIQIRWKGGATTSLDQPLPKRADELYRTPQAVVELTRALATEKTDQQIAQALNNRSLRSGYNKSFTSKIVKRIRTDYHIESLVEHLRNTGWLTVPEIVQQLNIHHQTAKRFAKEGVLRAIRSDDRGLLLFEPITGPLPKIHPGKRFKDRRQYPKLSSNHPKEVQYAV